ncbi:MAG: hypothetical protein ABI647_25485 [Gemmatimonadota bacterium]
MAGLRWIVVALPLLAACTAPSISALDAPTGPERTVVMVQGTNVLFSRIVWDAGLPGERTVPGGFLGGYMFSVPPGATNGPHPVALENGRGRSAPATFTVTDPVAIGGPRVDHVMLVSNSFPAPGKLLVWLYVQGANIDVGSVVQVDGVDAATVAHKALRNELFGIAPASLGFPIRHYLSLLAAPDTLAAGSTVSITVRNLDGTVSGAFPYTLPANAASVDSDGDGLLDTWETAGFDADGNGAVDVDLAALGAKPYRRDVLLEVDVMNGLANPPIATAPGSPGTFDLARGMFAAAPVINPVDSNGINLIIDASGTVPFVQTIGFGAADNAMLGTANYSTVKAANFTNAVRGNIYHYAVWGNAQPGGFSGISDIVFDLAGNVTGPGDDFIVSFDDFGASFQTLRSQVETLAHEFGHDLMQQHGGNNNNQLKPNYWSVMAYTWQLRTGRNNATRRQRVTCWPFYYAAAGATEPAGALPGAINAVVDYSEGMAASVTENNNTLNETTGVCGLAVDWNDDGDQADLNLSADADDDGVLGVVTDFANWRALNFRGPALNGTVLP